MYLNMQLPYYIVKKQYVCNVTFQYVKTVHYSLFIIQYAYFFIFPTFSYFPAVFNQRLEPKILV